MSSTKDDGAGSKPARRKKPTRFSRTFAKWMRWLHIYISMISFAIVLFFSVTGLTLNHPTWLGGSSEITREAKGSLPGQWVQTEDPPAEDGQADKNIQRLEIVEHLRSEEGVRGAVNEFTTDEYQVIVSFRAPAYSADIFIDRESGDYEMFETSFGLVALLNDLHKGRDSGKGWSWVIDVSAVVMTLVSLTGLTLIFYIKRHRKPGISIAVVGTAGVLLIYWALVPQ